MTEQPKFPQGLTEKEAAEFLTKHGWTMCGRSLARARENGRICFHKIGGRVRYTEQNLLDFIEASAIPARPPEPRPPRQPALFPAATAASVIIPADLHVKVTEQFWNRLSGHDADQMGVTNAAKYLTRQGYPIHWTLIRNRVGPGPFTRAQMDDLIAAGRLVPKGDGQWTIAKPGGDSPPRWRARKQPAENPER